MKVLIDLLQDIRPLSQNLRQALSERIQTTELLPKQQLAPVREANTLAVVSKGLLRIYHPNAEPDRTIAFFCEGQSFLQGRPPSNLSERTIIQALERTTVHYLKGADIIDLNAAFGLGEYLQVLIGQYFQVLQQRTQVLNVFPAAARYRYVLQHYPHWIQRIPTQYLASYMGVARETLSRIRSKRF